MSAKEQLHTLQLCVLSIATTVHHFPVAMVKPPGRSSLMRSLFWLVGSEGQSPSCMDGRVAGSKVDHVASTLRMWGQTQSFKAPPPNPSGSLPLPSLYLLKAPWSSKQRHQLENKCSNVWVSGEHSPSKLRQSIADSVSCAVLSSCWHSASKHPSGGPSITVYPPQGIQAKQAAKSLQSNKRPEDVIHSPSTSCDPMATALGSKLPVIFF